MQTVLFSFLFHFSLFSFFHSRYLKLLKHTLMHPDFLLMPTAHQSPRHPSVASVRAVVVSLSALGILTYHMRRARIYKCGELAVIDTLFRLSL